MKSGKEGREERAIKNELKRKEGNTGRNETNKLFISIRKEGMD